MEGKPCESRSTCHSSWLSRRKHKAPSPLQRALPGPHSGIWTQETGTGLQETAGGRGPSLPEAPGAPCMSGAHHLAPARAQQGPQRPAQGHLAASPSWHLQAAQRRGAVSPRGEHPLSHQGQPPKGAKGQEEPSVGSPHRRHQAFARDRISRLLCPEGRGGKLSSPDRKKGKEREGRSSPKSEPPSRGASHNPEKKRKRQHSGNIHPAKQGQLLQGLDEGAGPGGLLPKVRGKVGKSAKNPEGKGHTPHLGRKPVGPRPQLEEAGAAGPAEGDHGAPPPGSFQAYLTYDQPPPRKKRKSGKTPATALEGRSVRKEDSPGAKAQAGKSQKPPPPGAAGLTPSLVPPSTPAGPALPHLGTCQPSDPPLHAFPLTSSFQGRPRALPSPGPDEGARLMAIGLSSRTQGFSGSKRARRSRKLTLLKQCIQALQHNVYLLSQARGVPCSFPKPVLDGDAPEQLPSLQEQDGAPAAQTDPFWKKHCLPTMEKDTQEELNTLREPQEQEVSQQVLHISINRPKAPPANVSFSESSETGAAAAAAAAVQTDVLPAPSPTTGAHAASTEAARVHSAHPIPVKHVFPAHKQPAKKIAPLMAKSIRDYRNRYLRR